MFFVICVFFNESFIIDSIQILPYFLNLNLSSKLIPGLQGRVFKIEYTEVILKYRRLFENDLI